MMALRPELVRELRPHREQTDGSTDPRPYSAVRTGRHGFWQSIDGHTYSPDQADAGRGKQHLEGAVGAVSKAFVEFYQGSRSE
jgi:hypothetical protein